MPSSPLSSWAVGPASATGLRGRRLLAAALWRASRALSRWAAHLARPVPPRPSAQTLPRLEFHADAAAPEGALYVDGVLFGHLDGVTRL